MGSGGDDGEGERLTNWRAMQEVEAKGLGVRRERGAGIGEGGKCPDDS